MRSGWRAEAISSSYQIRDDDRYRVVVGWDGELETFYARVLDGVSGAGAVLARVGTTRLEIATISELQHSVARFASFDAATISALRHDATALWGHGTEARPPRRLPASGRMH
jgi:hypothetical protein